MIHNFYVWYPWIKIFMSGLNDTQLFSSGATHNMYNCYSWYTILISGIHDIYAKITSVILCVVDPIPSNLSNYLLKKRQHWSHHTSRNLWPRPAYVPTRDLTELPAKFYQNRSKTVTSMCGDGQTHRHTNLIVYIIIFHLINIINIVMIHIFNKFLTEIVNFKTLKFCFCTLIDFLIRQKNLIEW